MCHAEVVRTLLAALLVVALAAAPAAAQALAPTSHALLCFVDIDGDGARTLDEPAYLAASCADGVSYGDVRLNNSTYPGGTIVNETHDDWGRRIVSIGGNYAYFDADGGGAYNSGEEVFVVFGPLPGNLAGGDIPLTGEGSFHALRSDDSRVGYPVEAAPVLVGSEAFADTDDNDGYTSGDQVYLDMDGNGAVSGADILLGAPTPAPPPTPPTTSSTTPPTTSDAPASDPPSTTANTSSSTPPSSGTDTGTSGNSAPGFASVALVAALGTVLVLVRRRV